MVNKKYLYIALAVVALGLIIFMLFYESEEDKVKKQFTIISDAVDKQPGENPLVGAGKLNKLSTVFVEPCQIHIPAYQLSRSFTSRELSSYAVIRRTRFSTLSLDFQDITVAFPETGFARVSLTAILNGTLTSGKKIDEFHELSCFLIKTDDIWKIKEVRVVEVLEQ